MLTLFFDYLYILTNDTKSDLHTPKENLSIFVIVHCSPFDFSSLRRRLCLSSQEVLTSQL